MLAKYQPTCVISVYYLVRHGGAVIGYFFLSIWRTAILAQSCVYVGYCFIRYSSYNGAICDDGSPLNHLEKRHYAVGMPHCPLVDDVDYTSLISCVTDVRVC